MADAFFASVAANTLGNLLSTLAVDMVHAWGGHRDALRKLQEKVRQAQALLSDATSSTTSSVTSSAAGQVWLENFTDVVRDAENLLADVEYQLLRRKINKHSRARAKLGAFVRDFKLPQKIKSISASFDEIYKRGHEIGLRPADTTNAPAVRFCQTPPTGVDESQFVGREGDVCELVENLCSSTGEGDLSVLAIVGCGGLGKTTLAQQVCNKKEIQQYFGERIWVTVSEPFDTATILKEMLQSLTRENKNLTNIQALIKELKDCLASKRFLLVLDDVWSTKFQVWDKLRSSLIGMNAFGNNKILITTRSREVASVSGSCFTHQLPKLSQDDSWRLFTRRAFAEGGPKETENLRAIGKRMVDNCGGLPLALRVLGGLLYSKRSESEWLSTEKDPWWWKSEEVIPSLRISFDNLESSALKCCFAFCSIFTKDSVLHKDRLIQLWMASGFLCHPQGGDMEDVGEKYFNKLVWSSFLQDEQEDYLGKVCWKMHDLVHDLASDVSQKYRATLGASMEGNTQRAVQVSFIGLDEQRILEVPWMGSHRCQTLYIQDGYLHDKMVGRLKHLRVLVLSGYSIKVLPSSIGELKQLRYLDVTSTGIDSFPDSITKLYFLQTLRGNRMKELPKDFGNLINLRHLYFEMSSNCLLVGIGRATELRTLPGFNVNEGKGCRLEELGSLDKLSGELKISYLEGVSGVEAAKKAKLWRKQNITDLEFCWGDRVSTGDNNSNDDEGVLEGLQPHSNLKQLDIENFSGRSFASWMMGVDESSRVLENLVSISLYGCNHCVEIPALGHLRHLESIDIRGMKSVKRIGGELYGGSGATTTLLFPCLRELFMKEMPELEEWWEAEARQQQQQQVFPRLEVLSFINCPKLMAALAKMSRNITTLTDLWLESTRPVSGAGKAQAEEERAVVKILLGNNAPSLREIYLKRIALLPEEECDDISTNLEALFRPLTSLTSLWIAEMDELTQLPPGCLQFCTSLEDLVITDCPSLVSVPELGGLTRLRELKMGPFCGELDEFPWPGNLSTTGCSNLRLRGWEKLKMGPFCAELDEFPWPGNLSTTGCSDLTLIGWEKLKTLPPQIQHHLSASLKHLYIFQFDGLERLPDWMGDLSNLQSLNLYKCRNLESMPSIEAMQRLPTSMELRIRECPLLAERCRKGSGPEWPKIAHLSVVSITPTS